MSRTTGKDRNRPKARSAGNLLREILIIHDPLLIAYRASWWTPMRLVRASVGRSWMDATGERFANRYLPLLIGQGVHHHCQRAWLRLQEAGGRLRA